MMVGVENIFLEILQTISEAITTMIGMLPNPDPFPQIIAGLDVSSSDSSAIAFYWVNTFIDLSTLFNVLTAYFAMFGAAWVIMMLWKWVKAR